MITKLIMVAFVLTTSLACIRHEKSDNTVILANDYCDCVKGKLYNAKDSSVDIRDCNSVFFTNRLFSINFEEDTRERYPETVVDSANAFFLELGRVIDTACLDKIDPRKLKKIPHAPM